MIWDIDGGSRVAADQSRSLPTRLNLGCGYDIRPDYLNVDMQEFHHPDLVADITSLPMLPSGHFQEIWRRTCWSTWSAARPVQH